MRYFILILAILISVSSAGYLFPNCTNHCFDEGSQCETWDTPCRCEESSLLTDMPCCVIHECPLGDQYNALEFIQNLCQDWGINISFSQATCNGIAIQPGSAVSTITISTWSYGPYGSPSSSIITTPVSSSISLTAAFPTFTNPILTNLESSTTFMTPAEPTFSSYSNNIPPQDNGLNTSSTAVIASIVTLGCLSTMIGGIYFAWRRRKIARERRAPPYEYPTQVSELPSQSVYVPQPSELSSQPEIQPPPPAYTEIDSNVRNHTVAGSAGNVKHELGSEEYRRDGEV